MLSAITLSAGCISTPSDTPPVTTVPTTTPTPVPTPAPGQHTIMLNIAETFDGGDSTAKIVAPYHYEIYVNGIGYPAVSAVLPAGYSTFPTTNILKYATAEGWLTYIIPQGDAKLAYEVKEEPLGFIRINY